MAPQVRWDHGNHAILEFINDDPAPGEPNSGQTGVVPSGANTSILPLEIHWPDNYTPRFYELLGPAFSTLREDGNAVIWEYLDADFSPQSVRDALHTRNRFHTHAELQKTDYHFIRAIEDSWLAGKKTIDLNTIQVPHDVLLERSDVRQRFTILEQMIEDADIESLPDHPEILPAGSDVEN